MTPVVYINRHRVHRACVTLREGNENITGIAQQCGFYDSSHFIRC